MRARRCNDVTGVTRASAYGSCSGRGELDRAAPDVPAVQVVVVLVRPEPGRVRGVVEEQVRGGSAARLGAEVVRVVAVVEIRVLGEEVELAVLADAEDVDGDVHRPQDVADEAHRSLTAGR